MALFLKMTTSVQLSLRCACCGQMYNEKVRNETLVDVALFGTANPYVLCPVCLQQVPSETMKDAEYQRKARVEMYLRYQVVVRKTWKPDYSDGYEVSDEPRKQKKVDDE